MTTQVMLDRRTLMATLAALAVPVASRAATAAEYHNLQTFLDGYVNSRKLPGAVIAIKHADDPVQYMSAGTIAYDSTKKADPDSIYRVYSMTKPISGIAAMKLVEDGKIKLDQPISDILPDFKNMKVTVNQQTGEIRQSCDKCFYVSPFMDMELKYEFRVRPPGETFSIIINASDATGVVLNAHHHGKRVELTDSALLRTFAALPLQTLSVAGGIGWEALKIWWKGVAIRRRPRPPLQSISIVSTASHGSRGTTE